MIFGGKRDISTLRGIARELIQDVIEQTVGYYKISLEGSKTNIYGESLSKIFLPPVKLYCLLTRGDQVVNTDDFGPDLSRTASFAFLRKDLEDANTVPEVGDVILWNEDYYEVDTVRENQLFVGKDNNYALSEYGKNFGTSISIITDCHLTRGEKVGILPVR